MKVFISWSGDTSQKIAVILKEWLPNVIQSIDPYVSSESIDKGARWSTDISKELEASKFGILCVTQENLESAWLNFEAGAISKKVDKSFVAPLLIDLKMAELNGPLLQFQSTEIRKEDIEKLMISLNKASESDALEPARLKAAFEQWWPKLEEKLARVTSSPRKEISTKLSQESLNQKNSQMVEEILNLTRSQQRLLVDMRNGLGFQEMNEILRRLEFINRREKPIDPELINDLELEVMNLESAIDHAISINPEAGAVVASAFTKFEDTFHNLRKHFPEHMG